MADKYWFGGSGNFNTTANWAGGWPAGSEFGLTATFNIGSTSITFARSIGSGNPGIQTGGTNFGTLIRDNNNNLIGTISGGTWPTYTLVTNSAFTGSGVAVRFAANSAGTAPGAGDNVFFVDKSSTTAYTVTFSATTTVTDFTVFSGGPIVTFSGTSALNISGSLSVGASSATWSNTGTITFTSTTGTKTITSNGTVFTSPSITFNGVGGTWQLQDALNLSNTRTVALTNGTLDLNSKTLTTGSFSSSGSTARGVKFGTGGTGNITVNGASGTLWTTSTFTNFTVTDTPIVNVSSTATSGTTITVLPGAQTETSCLSYNFTSGSYTLIFLSTSSHNVKSIGFTGFTGSWVGANNNTIFGGLKISEASSGMNWNSSTTSLVFGATTGTWDIDTNGKPIDQPLIFGAGTVSGGTWRLLSNFVNGTSTTASTRLTTLTIGTLNLNNFTYIGGTFSSSNSNARTLAFGTGNLTLVAAGGIMWTTATFTNFAVTGTTPTVNISNNSGTATTITPGALAETTQSLNYNFTTGNYILTLTAGNYRSINFTGYSGQLQNTAITVYGDYTLSSVMTFSATITNVTTFASTSGTARVIRLNGKTIPFPIIFNGVGGSWSLFDTLTCPNISWSNGDLNLNNNTLNVNQFSATGTNRTFTFGTGSVIINSSSAISSVTLSASLTYATPNSTFTFSGSVNSHSFNNLQLSGTNQPKIVLPTGGGTINLGSVNADIVTTGFTGTLNLTGSPVFYNTTITTGFTLTGSALITLSTVSTNNTSVSIAYTLTSGIFFAPTSGRKIVLQNNISTNNTAYFSGAGTLDLNGYTLMTGAVLGSNGFITMNGGAITVTSNDAALGGAIWSDNTPGKVEFTDTTGVINFTANSQKTMITAATSRLPTIAISGTGTFQILASKLTNISSTGATVRLQPGSTFDFTDFTLGGCTLASTSAGNPATISKTGGTVSVSNLNIIDITATGTATWNAYTANGNTNGGGNTGWVFAGYGLQVFNSSGTVIIDVADRLPRYVANGSINSLAYNASVNTAISGMTNTDTWLVLAIMSNDIAADDPTSGFTIVKGTGSFTLTNTYAANSSFYWWVFKS